MAQGAPYANPMTRPGPAPGPKGPDLQTMIRSAAAKYNIPEALFAAIIDTESSGNPQAVSPKGAKGLGQLSDLLIKHYGVTDPFDPVQNLDASAKHLAYLLNKYQGSLSKAVAAYNAGEPAVDKANGVPNYPETIQYLEKVAQRVNTPGGVQPVPVAAGGPGGRTPPGYPRPYQNPMTNPGPVRQAEAAPAVPGVALTPPGQPTPYPNPMTRPTQAPQVSRPREQMDLVPRVIPPFGKADRNVPEGTVAGLTGMSNEQLDQLVAGDVDTARQYAETEMPFETRETGDRGGRVGKRAQLDFMAPDYAIPDQGYEQPSIAPFYSGGTFQAPGLGSLGRRWFPSGGRSFQDETPSEGR
jgi:Transglycosylase SLT domain